MQFNCFLPRRVRGKKHFSACKRANNVSALQQAVILLTSKGFAF